MKKKNNHSLIKTFTDILAIILLILFALSVILGIESILPVKYEEKDGIII